MGFFKKFFRIALIGICGFFAIQFIGGGLVLLGGGTASLLITPVNFISVPAGIGFGIIFLIIGIPLAIITFKQVKKLAKS